MELSSVLCAILDGSGVWGRRDTCICMTESLSCSPETTVALLIGYTPVQNENLKRTKISKPKIIIGKLKVKNF